MAGEDGDSDEHRRHGKILQEQDGECSAPGPGELPFLLGQQRHYNGRRRQGQRRPEQRTGDRALAEQHRQAGDGRRANHELQASQTEDQAPHRPQALPGQFQADGEEEEDDAELRKLRHLAGALDGEVAQPGQFGLQRAQPERTEYRAGAEKAQDGTKLPSVEDRDHDTRGDEEEDDVGVIRCRAFISHRSLSERGGIEGRWHNSASYVALRSGSPSAGVSPRPL